MSKTEWEKLTENYKPKPPEFSYLNTVTVDEADGYTKDDLVWRFRLAYYGLPDAYGVHSNPKSKAFKNGKDGKLDKKGYVEKEDYNDKVVADHLQGLKKVGPFMNVPNKSNAAKADGVDPNIADSCWWCALDVDEYNQTDLHKKLHDKIKKFNLPLVISRSSSGAAHVTMHFGGLVKSSKAIKILDCLVKLLELDPDTERFPKQDVVDTNPNEKGVRGFGNFLYMPYFGGDNSNQYSYDDNFNKNNVEQHCQHVDSKRTSIQEMCALLDPHAKQLNLQWDNDEEVLSTGNDTGPTATANGQFEHAAAQRDLDYGEDDDEIDDEDKSWRDVLVEGPPCLQAIVEDHPKKDGTLDFRNEILKQAAVMMSKFKPLDDDALLAVSDDLHTDNPLSAKDIRRIVSSHNKKNYDFKCKAEPFESRCNKEQCHINKYAKGLGKQAAGKMSNYILIKDSGKVMRVRPNNKVMSLTAAITSMRSEMGQTIAKEKKTTVEKYYVDVASKFNSVDDEDWAPDKPTRFYKDGPFGRSAFVNAFKPSGIKPIDIEISPLLHKLLGLQFSNEELFEVDDAAVTGGKRKITLRQLWLEWFAHIIQKPAEKTDLGWVFKSRAQGTGKSFWHEIAEVLLGEWNANLINIGDLQGNFADPYMEVLWVGVEEVYEQGAKERNKIAANVKRLMTALSQKGNMKCKEYKRGQLLGRFFFMSNADSPLKVETFDRRMVIHDLPNNTSALLAETKRVCTELKKWMVNEDGWGALRHYFQNIDISHFNPRMKAPETDAREQMIYEGMDDDKKKLITMYRDKEHPFMEGLHLFDPQAVADILRRSRDWVVKVFKEELGFVKVGVVQNCQFVIPVGASGLHNENPMNCSDGGKVKAHLWTDKVQIQKDFENGILKPLDLLHEFVRPIRWEGRHVLTWAIDKRLYKSVDKYGKVFGDPKLPEWFDELYAVEKSCF